jgi:hypothetical protein
VPRAARRYTGEVIEIHSGHVHERWRGEFRGLGADACAAGFELALPVTFADDNYRRFSKENQTVRRTFISLLFLLHIV